MKNSTNENKKGLLVIIGIILLLAIIVVVLFIVIWKDKKISANTSADINLEQMMEEIKDFNSLLSSDTLLENETYEQDDKICHWYGGDYPSVIERIKNIFSDGFSPDSNFKLVKNTYENGVEDTVLYVCVSQGCIPDSINEYELIRESKTDTFAEVRINKKYIMPMHKNDEKWQFDKPIVICK